MTDYVSILNALKEILDNEIENVVVMIEPPEIGASVTAEVGLFLTTEESREANLNTPSPYHNILNISILCSEYSPDGVLQSSQKRDALIGRVKEILHADRTLNGTVDNTQFGDISFETARGDGGFYSAANLILKAFVTS